MTLFRGLVGALLLGTVASVLACSRAVAQDEGWTANMASAMEQAKSENKDLLIDFTGSDWCEFCIVLKDEVFSQTSFQQEAPKHFVLVELDFPNDTSQLSEATQKQNNTWREKFEVTGFPSIYLTDATGRPYAVTGYEKGGADKYLAHLEGLRKIREQRDAGLDAAAKTTGIERAKHLDAALTAVGDELTVKFYLPELEEILTLDGANEAGLKQKYTQWLNNAKFDKAFFVLKQEFSPQSAPQAIKLLDEMLAKFTPDAKRALEAKLFRADIYGAMGRMDEMLALIDELLPEESFEPAQRVNLGLVKVSLLRKAGKNDEAIAFFDEVISLAGDDNFLKAQVIYFKGRVLSLTGKNEEALKLYDEAIATSDDKTFKAEVEKAKLQLKLAPGRISAGKSE
ncbi:MAG: thioredoxin family protein [Planctomycetia bacterium]|nr:thioredoxin family protein [Planctomycetia bacterium]